jgi:hypothetical protein
MDQEKKAADAKSAETTQNNTTAPKATEPEKVYTQKDMLLYCGLTGLITGVLGYFIGENRGEKKAKKKYEEAVNKWHSASGKKGKKDDPDQVFEL